MTNWPRLFEISQTKATLPVSPPFLFPRNNLSEKKNPPQNSRKAHSCHPSPASNSWRHKSKTFCLAALAEDFFTMLLRSRALARELKLFSTAEDLSYTIFFLPPRFTGGMPLLTPHIPVRFPTTLKQNNPGGYTILHKNL